MFKLVCLAISIIITHSNGETVYEALGRQEDLFKFRDMVNLDEVLRKLLQNWPVTVFAPKNEAIVAQEDWLAGKERNVVSYHVINLLVEKSMFPFSLSSSLAGAPPLYMSIKQPSDPSEDKEYYVNNAKILRSENFVSMEGNNQTLYVIDELLQPVMSSFPPTAHDILQRPGHYGVPNALKGFKAKVKEVPTLEELFNRDGYHTFFVPVASQDSGSLELEVDSWVIQGHVIPKKTVFTRLAERSGYPSDAYRDDIKVELSFLKESNNVINETVMYAFSNTLNSEHGHKKGAVLSKIVRANVPVKNGVVHFIEHPLMVIDTTVWKFLNQEKESRLTEFMHLVESSADFKDLLQSGQEKTLFAPSNEAFRRLNEEANSLIQANITNFLKLHLVMQSISTGDIMEHHEVIASDNKTTLFLRVHHDPSEVLTVQGGGVKATAIQPDVGAVDGMVHIVDRVLGIPQQTIYQRLQSELDLRFTYELGEQDEWGSNNLNNHKVHKNFTLFAPSNEAWEKVRAELPTAHKQIMMGVYPYHVHKILDRHLIVGKMLSLEDLEQMNEIQMVHGKFKIHRLSEFEVTPFPDNESVVIEWEGLRARVVHSDLQAVNGIIHVIDRVMMKKRDLTKSSSTRHAASHFPWFAAIASLVIWKFFAKG